MNTCKHEQRRLWDCGCLKDAPDDRCNGAFCDFNSQCAACDEILRDRPNLFGDELCAECGEEQQRTISGKICKNGHGGADTVEDGIASSLSAMEPLEHFSIGPPQPISADRVFKPTRVNVTSSTELTPAVSVETFEASNGAQGSAVLVRKPKRKATIGRRSKEDSELSDSTCTPKWLADFLYETRGPFAIDPASNDRSHIVAHWSYSLERKLDGTKLPWRGDAFLNWPYSGPLAFALKANYEMTIERCTELVVLCKLDTSTEWWDVITAPIMRRQRVFDQQLNSWFIERALYRPDMWLFKDRIQHDEHPELIERRRLEWLAAKARGEKPKTKKSGLSSNNFCSAMLHWRFDKEPLKLDKYATLWRRAAPVKQAPEIVVENADAWDQSLLGGAFKTGVEF